MGLSCVPDAVLTSADRTKLSVPTCDFTTIPSGHCALIHQNKVPKFAYFAAVSATSDVLEDAEYIL